MNTRRDFLATTSLAFACSALRARRLDAQLLPTSIGSSLIPVAALLPEPMAPLDMRALATHAVDAATSAGASYADIRVAESHELLLDYDAQKVVGLNTALRSTVTYGVRVLVNGTWAFVYGTAPSIDAVTTAARNAVETGRGIARIAPQRVELTPAPTATGEWSTPMQVDPFTVPLEEQMALMGAYAAAIARVYRGFAGLIRFHWTKETRVFASSEGALTTQTLYRSSPAMNSGGDSGLGKHGHGPVRLPIPQLHMASGGYETVAIAGLQDEITILTEEAVRLATLPRCTLDVGRYPTVFDGMTLGVAFGKTIGQALELDRVLGYEAGASGTSLFAPPLEALGTPIVSSLLSVSGHRRLPSMNAVKWDDEGVEPDQVSLITKGRLIDYCTSRQTASALRPWYESRGQQIRSHGCAVAGDASNPVLVRSSHLEIVPGITKATVSELCRDVSRGILVQNSPHFVTDQQLGSCTLLSFGAQMFEIVRGRITRRVEENELQFKTKTFWRSLVALGDSSTVRESASESSKGQPWQSTNQCVSSPAGLFKEADIISKKVQI